MNKYLLVFPIVALLACSDPAEVPRIESMEGQVGTDVVDEKASDSSEATARVTWNFYGGKMGDYLLQIVMELGFTGEEVSGRYFYAKHQKFLALTGVYDSVERTVFLTESYNGRITGYIEATLSEDGELEGEWYRDENSRDVAQPFRASPMALTFDENDQMSVSFAQYMRHHSIQIFNGAERRYDAEAVVDECYVSQLDSRHIVFSYSVYGDNGHHGKIEGVATFNNEDVALCNHEDLGCSLSFQFYPDSLVVRELKDCSSCRGSRAHFNNSLVKSAH